LASAFVSTSINGGRFGQAFMNSVGADFGALGANAVGLYTDAYTLPNVLGHAAVGCLAAAIAGRDCASGGIGAATSALVTPAARDALYSGENNSELVTGADGTLLMQQTYNDPVRNAMVTGLSVLGGGVTAGLLGRDSSTAADAARNEALNNALSPKLKELANAGPNCKAGSCVQYLDALKAEKARAQQEYDACMRAADCTAVRAADLSSDLLRLQTAYEQTVRRGIYVGDLKWNGNGNTVPADYFDGLTGLGAIGTGAALRVNTLRAGERPEGIASGGNRGSVNQVPAAQSVRNPSNTFGTTDGLSPDAELQARLPSYDPAEVRPAGNSVYGLDRQGVGAPKVGEVGVEGANSLGVPVTRPANPLSPVLELDAYGNEIMYRTMSEKQFAQLKETGKLPPTTETSISPSVEYSSKYDGVTVKITVAPGTSAQLQEIGIAANKPAATQFPNMPTQTGSWMQTNARFKVEGGQMTTQLGQGKAIDIFNQNIVDFELIRKGGH
jgi:filamentous hemagglutinin